jgi:hypothetical protein
LAAEQNHPKQQQQQQQQQQGQEKKAKRVSWPHDDRLTTFCMLDSDSD